jgi:formylglycine-generating enzyme
MYLWFLKQEFLLIMFKHLILSIFLIGFFYGCKEDESLIIHKPAYLKTPNGMVWIPGNTFSQGANDKDQMALPHEKPGHPVEVDGFFIDITEVTNAQFKKFVEATGYITTAEKPVDWEEMKKTLPEGTPKPCDSILAPGSLTFNKNVKQVNDYNNYGQWWNWNSGTNWKHPQGKKSSIENKMNYPVVHISYKDALAYCKWINRRLPTEAEWELAAKGNLKNVIYTWGNDKSKLNLKSNTWQGKFPIENNAVDGYAYISPVKSYSPNSVGLFDMAGNVWEYTQDFYNVEYYQELLNQGKVVKNPMGATIAFNPNNPIQKERILKGGSFLCNESYCASFRISARMGMSEDSSSDHIGFRTVATVEMLKKKTKIINLKSDE